MALGARVPKGTRQGRALGGAANTNRNVTAKAPVVKDPTTANALRNPPGAVRATDQAWTVDAPGDPDRNWSATNPNLPGTFGPAARGVDEGV